MPGSAFNQTIELADGEFIRIKGLVYDRCGINLSEGKRELVKTRLGKILRRGAFSSFGDYFDHVLSDKTGHELTFMLDLLTTNYTFFFREQGHFDYLRTEFIPEFIRKRKGAGRKLRLWSAACSSGEEPYSLAITLMEAIPDYLKWDISILATDLSTRMLKTASGGIYPREKAQSLPESLLKKYFLQGQGKWDEHIKIKDEVRKLVQYQRVNLISPFNFSEPFDCIFCRNVMIYFDKKTQAELVNKLYHCLDEGGVLMIGHSESLTGIDHPFRYLKPSLYRK